MGNFMAKHSLTFVENLSRYDLMIFIQKLYIKLTTYIQCLKSLENQYVNEDYIKNIFW